MSRRSKTKGDGGEREFLSLCRNKLKLPDLGRNLEQRRNGGPDANMLLGGFVLEIKRQRRWSNAFWLQAVRQAEPRRGEPALAYRGDWGVWIVMVPDHVVGAETGSGRVILTVDDWLTLVRQRMALERV